MKHLKFFENFENLDLSWYCQEYWDVDPEFLFECILYEVEDNSLKKMRFILEKEDKHNLTLIVNNKGELSSSGIIPKWWEKFFTEIKRIEEEKWYPEFKNDYFKKVVDSSTFKTSVYFEDIYTPTVLYGGGSKSNYFPEIQLGFDKDSLKDIGYWEDHFSSIFEKRKVPYYFDGESEYYESDISWFTLYHT